MATYDLTTTIPSKIQSGDILNCPYSGTYKAIILPKGVYKLEVWGAQGGSYDETYAAGGNGGYSAGTLTLNDEATTIYIYAGGKGSYGTSTTYTAVSGGGYNGGGNAAYRGGAGGGGSDIRIGSNSLYARVIVAGGGGGAYAYSTGYKAEGGVGGGTNGTDGAYYSSTYSTYAGKAGTQTSGGASPTAVNTSYSGYAGEFGKGGATGYKSSSTSYYSNGGGGGGWYGGSAADNYNGSGRTRAAAGGGGSGYIYTESTVANYPTGCLLNSTYYLTDASITSGLNSITDYNGLTSIGHAGNGACRITVIKVSGSSFKVKTTSSTIKDSSATFFKLNNSTWKETSSTWLKINNSTWKKLSSGGQISEPPKKQYILTNLIQDGNFSTSGYWTGSNCTWSQSNNIGTSTAESSFFAVQGQVYHNNLSVASGHIYYARVEVQYTANSSIIGGGNFDITNDNQTTQYISTDSKGYTGGTDYALSSGIGTISNTLARLNLILPVKDSSGSNIAKQSVQWKNAMLIDLTAAFGAGNEPDLTFCDTIEYFQGNVTVEK